MTDPKQTVVHQWGRWMVVLGCTSATQPCIKLSSKLSSVLNLHCHKTRAVSVNFLLACIEQITTQNPVHYSACLQSLDSMIQSSMIRTCARPKLNADVISTAICVVSTCSSRPLTIRVRNGGSFWFRLTSPDCARIPVVLHTSTRLSAQSPKEVQAELVHPNQNESPFQVQMLNGSGCHGDTTYIAGEMNSAKLWPSKG
jgi:hypothetical protein